jgi:hypothetical protein
LPSPFDKELPALPVLRMQNSPERRDILDATDSASKNLPYPVLQPELAPMMSPVHLNASPLDNTADLEATPSFRSGGNGDHQVASAPAIGRITRPRVSGPVAVRSTRASLLREGLNRSASHRSSTDYSLPAPASRLSFPRQSLGSQSSGSPVSHRISSRVPRATRSSILAPTILANSQHISDLANTSVNADVGAQASTQASTQADAQANARAEPFDEAAYNTLIGNSTPKAEDITVAEQAISENLSRELENADHDLKDDDKSRRLRVGVGPKLRFAGDATDLMNGTRSAKTSAVNKGEGRVVEKRTVSDHFLKVNFAFLCQL